MSQEEIKKFMKEKKLVIGTKQTLEKLRKGALDQVFVSGNCPEKTLDTLKAYTKVAGVKLEKLKANSSELGTLCKKQFSIAVLGVLKINDAHKV